MLAAVAAASAAGGYYYYTQTSTPSVTELTSKAKAAVKPSGNATLKGGDQGFVSLKLESVETVNHNTKKFRFALEEPDDVSGLKVACMWTRNGISWSGTQTDQLSQHVSLQNIKVRRWTSL